MNEIRSLTLMVCTYRRPQLLRRFIAAVRALEIPPGIEFSVVVSDNNPESHYDSYIRELLETLSVPTRYGHEPTAGYSNARNLALMLALPLGAEVLAFVDDDMLPEPDWLAGQLRSYAEFGCDGVSGAIVGHPTRYEHGQPRPVTGMGNTSFRRSFVAEDGLGLRFDPAFNKTGYEDQAFTSAASNAGKRIVYSDYPRVVDAAATGDNWQAELLNRARIAAITRRNRIVALRRNKGYVSALATAVGSIGYGAKSVGLTGKRLGLRLLSDARGAEEARISAWKEWHKMIESFRGLSGDEVARQQVRRGDE